MAARVNDPALELKAKLFRGFADPSRLALLNALRDGEMTVTELVEATGLSQPNASAHLACLRDCGLVLSRPEGRFVYYDIADGRTEELLHEADEILQAVAERIYACLRYDGSKQGAKAPEATSTGRRREIVQAARR